MVSEAGTKVPPEAGDVARRVLVLKGVVALARTMPPRGRLEALLQGKPEDREKVAEMFRERRERVVGRLREWGVWEEVTDRERGILEKEVLEMTEQEQIDMSWRMEGALVLMWALGMVERLPAFDEKGKPEVLKGVPGGEVTEFVGEARLRRREEIERARGVAEFWHWRSRTRQLIERGAALPANPQFRERGFSTYDEIVRASARKGAADGLFVAIDEDFPAMGKAYREMTAKEWGKVRSITMERHFALNWLSGYAPGNRWEATPTGT